MRNAVVLNAIVLFGCASVLGQNPSQVIVANDDMAMQLPALPQAGEAGAPPNVVFRTQHVSGDKMKVGFFAVSDSEKQVTGAPYSATAVTETTQVLADGNRIVNKTESQLARDSQGRTRRQEALSNIGPLATNAPKMAFINDPVKNVNYILDLNDKTADVLKVVAPSSPTGTVTPLVRRIDKGDTSPETVTVQKKMIMGGATPGVEQRVWVNSSEDGAVKTESLGTQMIEGVSATGTRTTRTIAAGEIGNERAIEITSEVWTSSELQMVVLSKRNDPRIGETVYKLTNLQRAEPDPSLFEVPSGFSIRQDTGDMTKPN